MTSTVTVNANSGRFVRVTFLATAAAETGASQLLRPGESGVFHAHDGQDLHVRELPPGDAAAPDREAEEPILRFFATAHLPPALEVAAHPFAMLARRLVDTLPRDPERSVALRKLLEAKDAAVRAALRRG